MPMNYMIKVYDDFRNDELKNAWHELENVTGIFPQMYYQWIEPWWKYNSSGKKLHIITVVDTKAKIVGIAPFCIEKRIGLKILRTIPKHFGDFYFMLVQQADANEIIKKIVNYTLLFNTWEIVHYFNINNTSLEYRNLKSLKHQKITDILASNFANLTFNEFLLTLSKNTRAQYKKKVNRLTKSGTLQLEVITDSYGYLRNFENTKDIYNVRWANDFRPLHTNVHYSMRNEALIGLFDKKSVVLYVLRYNNVMIAFRLGFLSNNTFYDWRVSHNSDYDYYSPGFILVGAVIEDLISKGYKGLNFMTGNYRFKRSWATPHMTTSNFEFLSAKRHSLGSLYVYYRLNLRDKLKSVYYKILKIVFHKSITEDVKEG